jgi:hypothetical protein
VVVFPTADLGERPHTPGVYARMIPNLFSLPRAWPFVAVASLVLAGCASSPTRSSTVIQPPAPPGLPRPPALRIPNPRGVEPASVGDIVRVEREPPAGAMQPQEAPTSPQPFAGAVWQPGYYVWQQEQYVWVPGRWAQPPAGKTSWVAPRWEQRSGGYVFVEGYWR